jgi:hypothetical protein
MELSELPDCPLEELCAKAVRDADRISANASVKNFFMRFQFPLFDSLSIGEWRIPLSRSRLETEFEAAVALRLLDLLEQSHRS